MPWTRRTAPGRAAAGAMLLGLTVAAMLLPGLAAGAGAAAGAAGGGPDRVNLPTVYGGGIRLAFSGLDGRTSWAEPVVASTAGEGLALRFHLPKDPVLKIRGGGAGPEALRWRMVTNDLLVAEAPGDASPLVLGLVSNHVLAGRLPADWRVALEGGDPGAVLLRRAVGDRTVFTFAYSSKGPKEAAEAASQALKVSLDTLIEARQDYFEHAPAPPVGTDRARAAGLAKALSVLKATVYAPEEPLAVRWTTPARWPNRDMGLAESAFHALGLMHTDAALAKEALRAVYGFQTEEGMIPQRMSPGGVAEVSHPPILGWAAWQVYAHEKMRDREFLQRSFEVAQKHVVWYMKKRRMDGEPPPEKVLEHGTPLYAWKSAEESGAENSPRFEAGAEFAAVDLACYLANECATLQAMAQKLGYRELAKAWGARGEAIASAARRCLWHGERGFFFDRKGPDGEWIDTWTAAGLLPLWAGVATPEQAARLRAHLLDAKKFWTAFPVPTVARDDPKFKKDMWQGPTWVHMNYLLIQGLRRYGFEPEAVALRDRTLSAAAAWYARTGCLYEFYDCEDQTPPPALDRKGSLAGGGGPAVVADWGPTAALYADLLLRPR